MGRYWYLRAANDDKNINCYGKCWFGHLQGSDDVFEKLGFVEREDSQELVWKSCSCRFRTDNRGENYCVDCFECFEDHKKAVEEEEGEDVDCLYFRSNVVAYEVDKLKVYHIIRATIEGYEDAGVHNWFEKYKVTAIEKDEIIEVDSTWKFLETLPETQMKIMATYDLCKIVKYVFDLGVEEIFVDCEC